MGKHKKSKLGEKFCEKSNGLSSFSEINSSFGKLVISDVVSLRVAGPMFNGREVTNRGRWVTPFKSMIKIQCKVLAVKNNAMKLQN